MSTVDLSERDNKETLFVKEEVTDDAEVFGGVKVDVEGVFTRCAPEAGSEDLLDLDGGNWGKCQSGSIAANQAGDRDRNQAHTAAGKSPVRECRAGGSSGWLDSLRFLTLSVILSRKKVDCDARVACFGLQPHKNCN